MNTNDILTVTAQNKGTGNASNIQITNEKGGLSKEVKRTKEADE